MAFSFMSAFVIVHQPTIGATINALPLFVVTLGVGVIGFPLLWRETAGGYWSIILVALLGLASLGPVAEDLPTGE